LIRVEIIDDWGTSVVLVLAKHQEDDRKELKTDALDLEPPGETRP